MIVSPTMSEKSSQLGFGLAILAFLSWGLFPIYWKQVDFCEPLELLFWRLSFTALFLAPFSLGKIKPKQLLFCLFLGVLISLNWGAFIWAISNGYLLQSSLAYFLAPLFSVLFAALVLKESLSPVAKIAVALALLATAIKLIASTEPIYAALIMAFSFSLYGLFKKLQSLRPFKALFYESIFGTCILLAFLETTPSIFKYSLSESFLLSLAGPVTIFPLILFAYAAKLIKLQSLGFLNYVVPIFHLLLAVLLYGEPFRSVDIVSFSLIWIAIALFLQSSQMFKRNQVALGEI